MQQEKDQKVFSHLQFWCYTNYLAPEHLCYKKHKHSPNRSVKILWGHQLNLAGCPRTQSCSSPLCILCLRASLPPPFKLSSFYFHFCCLARGNHVAKLAFFRNYNIERCLFELYQFSRNIPFTFTGKLLPHHLYLFIHECIAKLLFICWEIFC